MRSSSLLIALSRCDFHCSLTCAWSVHFNKHPNPCCLWHLQDVGHAVSGSPLRQCRKTTNLATATAELLLSIGEQKLRSRQPLVESFRCNLCLFQLCDFHCSLTCASNVHFNKHPNPCCSWYLQDVGHAVSGSPLRQCRKTTNLATATAELLLSIREQKLRSRQPLVESFRCNLCLFQLCDFHCSLTCASNVHFNKHPNPCCLWHLQDVGHAVSGSPLRQCRKTTNLATATAELLLSIREQKLRSRQPLVESFRCNLCLFQLCDFHCSLTCASNVHFNKHPNPCCSWYLQDVGHAVSGSPLRQCRKTTNLATATAELLLSIREQKLCSRQPLVESFRCNLCLFQLCDFHCSLTCASNVHFNKHPNPCCLWHLQDVGHAVSGSPLRQCRKTTNLATATAELLLSKVPLSRAKAPQSTALGGIVSLQSLFVSTSILVYIFRWQCRSLLMRFEKTW